MRPLHTTPTLRSIQLDLQLCWEKDEKEGGEEVLHEEEEEAVMVVAVTQGVLTGSAVEIVHQPVVGRRRKV